MTQPHEVTVTDAEVRHIELTRGYVAIVDAEDYERISAFKWCATLPEKGRHGPIYAMRKQRVNGKLVGFRMHRVILNAPLGMAVDHINGNGLDNRKSNLRLCVLAENNNNRGPNFNSRSGFKGASLHKKTNRWMARIGHKGKSYHLGYYSTPEEAGRAYDAAAARLHGDFAFQNFANKNILRGPG